MCSQYFAGAGHGDELSYIFAQAKRLPVKPESPEDVAIKRVTKIWTNFAKYGNPAPEEKDVFVNVVWKPVMTGELNYVNIGKELSAGVNPDADKIAFWDRLYDKYPAAKYW